MSKIKEASSNNKKGLGWIEWLRGCFKLIHEMLFQRIMTRHLENPLPLPLLDRDFTCIVTGCTNGIGREIARWFVYLFMLLCS